MVTQNECRKILYETRKRLRRALPGGYRFDDDIARGLSLPMTPPSKALRRYLKCAAVRLCLRAHDDFPERMVVPEAFGRECGFYVLSDFIDPEQLLQNPPEALSEVERGLVRKLRKLYRVLPEQLD